jgi:ketosteroid isomerase-like protein
MTTDTVVVAESGEFGYTLGHWTVGLDTPGGRAEAAGEYLAVWRRRLGTWKIVALTAYTFR